MSDDVVRRINEMGRKAKVEEGVIFRRKDDTILTNTSTTKTTPDAQQQLVRIDVEDNANDPDYSDGSSHSSTSTDDNLVSEDEHSTDQGENDEEVEGDDADTIRTQPPDPSDGSNTAHPERTTNTGAIDSHDTLEDDKGNQVIVELRHEQEDERSVPSDEPETHPTGHPTTPTTTTYDKGRTKGWRRRSGPKKPLEPT